jgi:hypothetical protein
MEVYVVVDTSLASHEAGVEMFSSVPVDVDQVSELMRECGARYGAEFSESFGSVAVFDVDGHLAELSITPTASESPHVATAAAILEKPPTTVLRLTVKAAPEALEARLNAEATMTAVLAASARQWPLVAIDDNGAIYDPLEISVLAAQGETRGASFAYNAAENLLAATHTAEPDTDFAPLDTASLPSPADAAPDARTERAIVFGLNGKRLPLLETVRILMGLANDPRLVVNGRSVVALAPALDPDDASLLRTFGASVATSQADLQQIAGPPQAAGTEDVRTSSIRDELLVLSAANVNLEEVRAVIDAFCAELNITASILEDSIIPTDMQSLRFPSGIALDLPVMIAALRGAGTAIDIYYLDPQSAAPQIAEAVRRRVAATPMTGEIPGFVVAIEIRAADAAAYARADALVTALCAFMSEFGIVASDVAGGVYGGAELRRLAATRRGRALSWSARLAQLDLAGTRTADVVAV